MQNTFAFTIIDANTGQPNCEIKLPFLPSIGMNLIIGNKFYKVLEITSQVEAIQVAIPDQSKVITMPGINNSGTSEGEIIIPTQLLCAIASIEELQKQSQDTTSESSDLNK